MTNCPVAGADIQRTGDPGNYSYTAPNYPNRALRDARFYNTLRFANWLHNGQGTGDTETGVTCPSSSYQFLWGIESRRCVSENADNTHYVKLLTIGDKLSRCGALELGGKSPNIVFADADLERATIGTSTAAVFTGGAGQTCVAGSRL